MASLGLFFDNVVRSIVKSARRSSRLHEAAQWPIKEARISRVRTYGGDGHLLRPAVDFEYELNGETEYGSATGFSLEHEQLNPVCEAAEALQTIRVRYSPTDPGVNCVLGEDNSNLPFEIDYDIS